VKGVLEKLNKVFLDIGSHKGQSVVQFYNEVADASQWKIFAFEPLYYDKLVLNVDRFDNVTCVKGAVCSSDGYVDMFIVPDEGEGATIVQGKLTGGITGETTRVISIDIKRWIEDNTDVDDMIVIKMNIEGAEYEVLDKLPLDRIYSAWIKLHHLKFKSREKLIESMGDFKAKIKDIDKFIYLDDTEGGYNFKRLVC
jgi:FkbM family methyltransferase